MTARLVALAAAAAAVNLAAVELAARRPDPLRLAGRLVPCACAPVWLWVGRRVLAGPDRE